jgi:hypothetical protein
MRSLATASPGLIYELLLVDLLAISLSVATVSILWYVVKKAFQNEVRDLQFFLTFVVVIIPFVILLCFGLAITIDDAIAAPPWPMAMPVKLSRPEVLSLAVIYIGLTVRQWMRWNRDSSKRDTKTRRAG